MVFFINFMQPILRKNSNPVLELKFRIQKVTGMFESDFNSKNRADKDNIDKGSVVKKIIEKYNKVLSKKEIVLLQRKMELLAHKILINSKALKNKSKISLSPAKSSGSQYFRRSAINVNSYKSWQPPAIPHVSGSVFHKHRGSVATVATIGSIVTDSSSKYNPSNVSSTLPCSSTRRENGVPLAP